MQTSDWSMYNLHTLHVLSTNTHTVQRRTTKADLCTQSAHSELTCSDKHEDSESLMVGEPNQQLWMLCTGGECGGDLSWGGSVRCDYFEVEYVEV